MYYVLFIMYSYVLCSIVRIILLFYSYVLLCIMYYFLCILIYYVLLYPILKYFYFIVL